MASTTSNDGRDSESLADGLPGAPAPPRSEHSPPEEDDGDVIALGEGTIRINPEILRGVPPLHGLDGVKVKVVVLQPAQSWARRTEALMLNVAGNVIYALIGILLGLGVAGSTIKAENTPFEKSCVTALAPEKAG